MMQEYHAYKVMLKIDPMLLSVHM